MGCQVDIDITNLDAEALVNASFGGGVLDIFWGGVLMSRTWDSMAATYNGALIDGDTVGMTSPVSTSHTGDTGNTRQRQKDQSAYQ